jgi:enoyl-CoA hydratase/carnithine racemase
MPSSPNEMTDVRVERREAVGVVTIDRPEKRNALSPEVLGDLATAVEAFDADEDVRCIVIAGSDDVFAAGADIKAMAERSFQDVIERSTIRFWHRIAACRTPLIAAVSGFALGGGCELALLCDMIVASETAEFGQPEITLGIIPGGGGTQRMARLIGPSRAKDLIFTGRMVDAQEALAIGLVDQVVPADEVYSAARSWAEQFVDGPAMALAAAKKAIDGGLDVDLRTGLDLEAEFFAALFATEDRQTGMTSFAEHGPGKAKFSGH